MSIESLERRTFLLASAAILASSRVFGQTTAAGQSLAEYRLRAAPGMGYLSGAPYPRTPVWCFNDSVPGPVIRARQGDRLRIVLENALEQGSTLHCHGIRLPNAMDGVPGVTQPLVEKGGTFVYEFDLPDAGTYWYHPHHLSSEQIGRGLYGALIVEEREPVDVDREMLWVLDDWRLREDATISDDFKRLHDATHAGRFGNLTTVNGNAHPSIAVRSGERIRLRIVNAANARPFVLDFGQLEPSVIAIDGQPVTPHAPERGRVVIAAAMRVDLVLDMMHEPDTVLILKDRNDRDEPEVLRFAYSGQPPVRDKPAATSVALPPNDLPEPDLKSAEHHDIVLAGGAMGQMREAMFNGKRMGIRELVREGKAWAINETVGTMDSQKPLLRFQRDRTYMLRLQNDTAFAHPMHLHGHSFRVIARDGVPTRYREWQDTVLVERGQVVDIAFVADNPGNWMFHCHVLEHQASGMSCFVSVT